MPRDPAPELTGDWEGAAAFFQCDRTRLSEIVAMICSGIPEAMPCRAHWSRAGRGDGYVMQVDEDGAKMRLTFMGDGDGDGLRVGYDLWVLRDTHHKGGHAQRLIRNLAYLFTELKVALVSVYADHGNGAYTWAKLGAVAMDPEGQREILASLVRKNASRWDLDDDQVDDVLEIIRDSADDVLMYEVARLQTETIDIGRELLVGHQWDGYWSLQDPRLREFIKGAVG